MPSYNCRFLEGSPAKPKQLVVIVLTLRRIGLFDKRPFPLALSLSLGPFSLCTRPSAFLSPKHPRLGARVGKERSRSCFHGNHVSVSAATIPIAMLVPEFPRDARKLRALFRLDQRPGSSLGPINASGLSHLSPNAMQHCARLPIKRSPGQPATRGLLVGRGELCGVRM